MNQLNVCWQRRLECNQKILMMSFIQRRVCRIFSGGHATLKEALSVREHELKSGKTSVFDAFLCKRVLGGDGDQTLLPTLPHRYCGIASLVSTQKAPCILATARTIFGLYCKFLFSLVQSTCAGIHNRSLKNILTGTFCICNIFCVCEAHVLHTQHMSHMQHMYFAYATYVAYATYFLKR